MSLEAVREERQRVEALLAKREPEVVKLKSDLVQLANAEEVLLRLVGETPVKRRGRPPRVQTEANAPRLPQVGAQQKEGSPLSGVVLDIVRTHPEGIDQAAVNAAVQAHGLSARANHVGIALKRHLRGGRIAQSIDGSSWFPVAESEEGQPAHGEPEPEPEPDFDEETEQEREAAE
jgi:hypothetical protein